MVEGARLERVCASNRTQGSNPCLSARNCYGSIAFFTDLCYNKSMAFELPDRPYHIDTIHIPATDSELSPIGTAIIDDDSDSTKITVLAGQVIGHKDLVQAAVERGECTNDVFDDKTNIFSFEGCRYFTAAYFLGDDSLEVLGGISDERIRYPVELGARALGVVMNNYELVASQDPFSRVAQEISPEDLSRYEDAVAPIYRSV